MEDFEWMGEEAVALRDLMEEVVKRGAGRPSVGLRLSFRGWGSALWSGL